MLVKLRRPFYADVLYSPNERRDTPVEIPEQFRDVLPSTAQEVDEKGKPTEWQLARRRRGRQPVVSPSSAPVPVAKQPDTLAEMPQEPDPITMLEAKAAKPKKAIDL